MRRDVVRSSVIEPGWRLHRTSLDPLPMTFLGILVLSVGLAMDATAAAAARGVVAQRIRTQDVLLIALLFGGFQAAMPVLGWYLGATIGPWVRDWDHWIAFVLLSAIGARMLHEARTAKPEAERATVDEAFHLRPLLVLSVATSIDALAVGVTLPMIGAPLLLTVATIGVTTALLSGAGVIAGKRLSKFVGRKLDVFGGLVLIAMGLKVLLQHLLAN